MSDNTTPVPPRIWCETCTSWRYSVPCGRDECPHEYEHAGGSLNGPRLGQSPQLATVELGASLNTDTGGESVLVLVPAHVVARMRELISVTKLGLHGTPWAQAELRALAKDLEASVIVGTDLEGRAGKPPLVDQQDYLSATSKHIEASKVSESQGGGGLTEKGRQP